YHWRTNLAVVAGVATAVAVLAGALLVGDSVRGSLRELVLGRLGKTDAIIAGTNFFRSALATELGAQRGVPLSAYPLIAVEGVVVHSQNRRVASKVAIYGVDAGFWKFHGLPAAQAPSGRTARLSPALREELAAGEGDGILIRLDKPSEIPVESLHGRKDESIKAVRVTAGSTLPPEMLGEFALRPQQGSVRAVFVALDRLQRELAQPDKANVILLATDAGAPRIEGVLRERATLDDMGIRVKPLADRGQLSVETASMVISPALERAASAAAREAGLTAEPVLTYLVNAIAAGDKQVPYSLITALELKRVADSADPASIVLNQWAAADLNARPGDTIRLDYYVWTDGRIETRSASLKLSAVVPMKGPAADRDFAPDYPGITEARTIHDWDPPFPMDLNRIRKKDEDYWDEYRTTPKGFISTALGARLWASRFGNLTSLRVFTADLEPYSAALRNKLDPAAMGLAVIPVRADGLEASQGATDFGQYFLYFSFFLVVSALLLVGLFFRLGVEQRYKEAGLLRAIGFPVSKLNQLFLGEGAVLAGLGAMIGVIAAAAYAALILYGLRTWWVDAVGTRLLRLHLSPVSLTAGATGGFLTAILVVFFTVRGLRRPSPRALLMGSADEHRSLTGGRRLLQGPLAIGCGVLGAAMLAAALLGKMDAAGGFFGAGVMFLISALAVQRIWLGHGVSEPTSVWRLGLRNAAYRPGRSVLSMALIAFATFLILALTAFRQEGASNDPAKRPGTGGFALVGEAVLPVIHNPGTTAGRSELAFAEDSEALFQGTRVIPLRLRPGDDASCLNLYAPKNPRVLGVPEELIRTARFPLAGEATWAQLNGDGPEIPAFVDANSLQYVLHKSIGDVVEVGGAKLKITAALKDSIFQGELIIAEKNFTRAFPGEQGYRVFLVQAPAEKAGPISQLMEERMADFGLDMKGAPGRLAEFHKVENAYISTFQSLGGLGLLLGTVGLGAVLLRNVLERRKELALLRAVGYQPSHLATMVLAENTLLLVCGLLVGALCAALAIAPALSERGTHLPLGSMAMLLAGVFAVGMLASLAAVKAALRSPLLQALRSE
ncbi:MAG: ABC transporter permease, partial [Bryobacteraceae bacterium]|nr:ABC transporter permease [Bryobacteraceae bacterium]